MLQRAAQRGVRVNIIVYKEVTQALTSKYIPPTGPANFTCSFSDLYTLFLVALLLIGLRPGRFNEIC